MRAVREVFLVFLRLGCTSFGGPVAHLGYFRAEFVGRRRWIEEAEFADLVALCQFLPGPASSQVGMGLGLLRAGAPGMLAAWAGFTLPSALLMSAFGYGLTALGDVGHAPWVKGLKLVAVAVVAQAVWGMARNLCPDRPRASLAVAASVLALAAPSALGQIGAILLGAAGGLWLLPPVPVASVPGPVTELRVPRGVAIGLLAVFFLLLLVVSPLAAGSRIQAVRLFGAFYRSGALVFGGGHVMLPLLQAAVVPPGWIGNDAFLAGYGAAQALPGPLTTFSAYLGTVMRPAPNGWRGALLCLASIFLPSMLLVAGAMPFWGALRRRGAVQAALRGVNAAVVGVLLAALFTPVWTGAVSVWADFALVMTAFLLLAAWAVPPWLVVLLGAGAAAMLGALGVPV